MSIRISLALFLLVGCADGTAPGGVSPVADAAAADADPLILRPDASVTPVQPTDDVLVYAHSETELLSLDPTSLTVQRIGPFLDAAGRGDSITDIAITAGGEIYGCSFTMLYRIDPGTARLTPVGPLDGSAIGFNALTFIKDASGAEKLVAASGDGQFFEVDPNTGAVAPRGTYSAGYLSSGDIVSVERAGTFATVLGPTSDVLVRIDPATGAATNVGNGTGFRDIWGLGYFRQKLYGFTADGLIVVIDVNTGVGQLANTTSGTSSFWGAGVTTIAPVDLI